MVHHINPLVQTRIRFFVSPQARLRSVIEDGALGWRQAFCPSRWAPGVGVSPSTPQADHLMHVTTTRVAAVACEDVPCVVDEVASLVGLEPTT